MIYESKTGPRTIKIFNSNQFAWARIGDFLKLTHRIDRNTSCRYNFFLFCVDGENVKWDFPNANRVLSLSLKCDVINNERTFALAFVSLRMAIMNALSQYVQ